MPSPAPAYGVAPPLQPTAYATTPSHYPASSYSPYPLHAGATTPYAPPIAVSAPYATTGPYGVSSYPTVSSSSSPYVAASPAPVYGGAALPTAGGHHYAGHYPSPQQQPTMPFVVTGVAPAAATTRPGLPGQPYRAAAPFGPLPRPAAAFRPSK
jgi:hypothetical protein